MQRLEVHSQDSKQSKDYLSTPKFVLDDGQARSKIVTFQTDPIERKTLYGLSNPNTGGRSGIHSPNIRNFDPGGLKFLGFVNGANQFLKLGDFNSKIMELFHDWNQQHSVAPLQISPPTPSPPEPPDSHHLRPEPKPPNFNIMQSGVLPPSIRDLCALSPSLFHYTSRMQEAPYCNVESKLVVHHYKGSFSSFVVKPNHCFNGFHSHRHSLSEITSDGSFMT